MKSNAGMVRAQIIVVDDESQTNDLVIGQLGQIEQRNLRVFNRGGVLVSVIPVEDPDIPIDTLRVHPLSLAGIRERITHSCNLVVAIEDPSGDTVLKPVKPSKSMVEQIAYRGHFGESIKQLSGIIQAPTLRKDGSILQKPGYDEPTGLIYQPLIEFPEIPKTPTRYDIQESIERIRDVVFDFPFVGPADIAVWLTMLLTMLARHCIDGSVPMFAIGSNIRGSGKSLLVDTASTAAFGRCAPRFVYSADNEEMRKVITSITLAGEPVVLFDNVDETIRGAALDAALTSKTWKDRLLGQSRLTPELPMSTVFVATGNNLSYGTDIARRVIPLRLNSLDENPEERSGFRHNNLIQHVQSNRAVLVASALTILRGYFAADKPEQPGSSFGSFDEWSETIRGAVVWAGLVDPLSTRIEAKSSDESADLLAMLIAGLINADSSGSGVTASKIVDLVFSGKSEYSILKEAVTLLCVGKVTSRKIAGRLRAYKGRVCKNTRINYREGRGRTRYWYVETIGDGDKGDKGDNVYPYAQADSVPSSSRDGGDQSHQRHHCHHEDSYEAEERLAIMDQGAT